MTHTCCPACRLRLTTATASGLTACPSCAGPLSTASPAHVLGFRLWEQAGTAAAQEAFATALAQHQPPPPGEA